MTGDLERVATCSCGQLRITASGDPDEVVACNCFECQRCSGTPFGVGAYFQHTNVRSIDTIQFRGHASDNNWSSCSSCHPDGLSDNVTWIFPTGPRQTPPLDASFSAADTQKQRVFNWNAVRGSVTDFNNNSRNFYRHLCNVSFFS